MENYYLIGLDGKNPESINKFAKISINKKYIIGQYKWYLGKNGYPFTFIKGARVPIHRYVWYLNTGLLYETNQPLHHIKLKKLGYEVCLNKNGLTNKIGKIATIEEAKQIYNLMATEMFGSYAVLY
jgi:hypothetical protein